MIRGIAGVVRTAQLVVGQFYLAATYRGGSVLFQCIGLGEEGDDEKQALLFTPEESVEFALRDLPEGPFVALPEVGVRVDAPSLTTTSSGSTVERGMLIVSGDKAFVAAQLQYRNWALIDLTTGRLVSGSMIRQWVSFSRWFLVIQEAYEEVRIASFDRELSAEAS